MTAKFNQASKDAFLSALAETGNQTLAAERAKVSRSWVQSHRSRDPAFRRALAEAVEQANASFDKLGTSGGRAVTEACPSSAATGAGPEGRAWHKRLNRQIKG